MKDGARPVDLVFAPAAEREADLEKHAFRYADGNLLHAVWMRDAVADDYRAAKATLTVDAASTEAAGYESLNGQEQPFDSACTGKSLEISRLRIRNFPLTIR